MGSILRFLTGCLYSLQGPSSALMVLVTLSDSACSGLNDDTLPSPSLGQRYPLVLIPKIFFGKGSLQM